MFGTPTYADGLKVGSRDDLRKRWGTLGNSAPKCGDALSTVGCEPSRRHDRIPLRFFPATYLHCWSAHLGCAGLEHRSILGSTDPVSSPDSIKSPPSLQRLSPSTEPALHVPQRPSTSRCAILGIAVVSRELEPPAPHHRTCCSRVRRALRL
jgi:hypothetical protein